LSAGGFKGIKCSLAYKWHMIRCLILSQKLAMPPAVQRQGGSLCMSIQPDATGALPGNML
jgi:hypothetical protein